MTRTRTGLVVLAAAAVMSHAGCKHSGSASRQSAAGAGGEGTTAQQDHPAVAAAAQPAATPPANASQVQGRIESIDRGNNVTLAGSEAIGHAFDHFKIDDDTRVTVNGEKADLAELNEGDDVRASFSTSDGELHLDRIEVLTPSDVNGSGASR
jgi:Cu/Ag efflux protein CusF